MINPRQALLAIWVLASGLSSAQNDTRFEIDLILPQNETYENTEYFPVVVALKNLTAVQALPNVTFGWYIEPFSGGVTPGGISYDDGNFLAQGASMGVAAEAGDYTVFADATNASRWIGRSTWGDKFMLIVSVTWQDGEHCGYPAAAQAAAMFGIDTATEDEEEPSCKNCTRRRRRPGDGEGVPADPSRLPECPPLVSQAVEIDATHRYCVDPHVPLDFGHQNPNDGCAVRIDGAAASKIASEVTVMGAPTSTTNYATSTPTPSRNAALATAGPGQAVLAAACLLYGLAL